MLGYDPSLFVEPAADSRELEELTCVICSCIVRSPLNLPCGDLFCLSCLQQAFAIKRCCPSCKQQISIHDCQPAYTIIKKIWSARQQPPHQT